MNNKQQTKNHRIPSPLLGDGGLAQRTIAFLLLLFWRGWGKMYLPQALPLLRRGLGGGVLLILACAPVYAQDTPKSLEACLRMALENNPALQSGRLSVERAKDLQGTAFSIDRTSLSLSQDPTSGGSPDNSLSLTQSFEFPTVYAARYRLRKAETEVERKTLELSRNELLKEVTATYYQLLYARECLSLLAVQDSLYNRFLVLAAARREAGETNALEQINAERLVQETRTARSAAEKTFRNLQMTLQAWLNTDEWITPVETVNGERLTVNGATSVGATHALPLHPSPFTADTLIAPLTVDRTPLTDDTLVAPLTVDRTPLTELYEVRREAASRNVRLQKQQFLPAFTVSFRNQLLLPAFNPYGIARERFAAGNFMGFEIGLNFPLFFGGQRAFVKAANKEAAIADLHYQNVLLQQRTAYRTLLNQWESARQRVAYYHATGNAHAGGLLRLSQAAYEKGEINYVEYLQNVQAALEIKEQYAAAVNEYNQLVITLKYTVNGEW